MTHHFTFRIYYQDTDTGGIVYHSKYFDFAERARGEMLIDMGVSNKKLIEQHIAFVVQKGEIEYKNSARLDDVVEIKTHVVETNNASIKMQHHFYANDTLLVIINLKIAIINPTTMRPTRLTPEIKQAFNAYLI